mmetsp:Transcript_692/g.1743  ORF Transcript_692/g.1743 Transcript_692/m.1743 type:complete len:230 (+) Transcript_692:424-1113(+)
MEFAREIDSRRACALSFALAAPSCPASSSRRSAVEVARLRLLRSKRLLRFRLGRARGAGSHSHQSECRSARTTPRWPWKVARHRTDGGPSLPLRVAGRLTRTPCASPHVSSAVTVSACPPIAAMSSGPNSSGATNTGLSAPGPPSLSPYASSSSRHSVWPPIAAWCSGVAPCASGDSSSQPAAPRSWASSRCAARVAPICAAACSAEHPLRSARLAVAPAASSALTRSA